MKLDNKGVIKKIGYDGTVKRIFNGMYNWIKGPAIEWPNGNKYWYIQGVQYTESEYWQKLVDLGIITKEDQFVEMI